MRTISVGHLVLEEGMVEDPRWEFSINGAIAKLEERRVLDWNYFSDISVTCTVEVDLGAVRQCLEIAEDLTLAWVIVARSSVSPLITTSPPLEVCAGPQEVTMNIPGTVLGGILTLGLEMGVSSPSSRKEGSSFAPNRAGHVVYQNATQIVLEGDAGQLPILPVSFSDHGVPNPSSSLWWLRLLSKDLQDQANAALWMWLNTDNPELDPLIQQKESEASDVWMRVLKIDFVRQLLREAISHPDLEEASDYPDGSLGALLLGVTRLVGTSLEEVRSRYADDPGRVEADLQGAVNVGSK